MRARPLLATTLLLGVAAVLPTGPAAAELTASGPFQATADAGLLRVDVPALSPAILPQTNVDLARSVALADSDGDVDPEEAGAQPTGAVAATTGTSSLLGAPLDLQSTRASAPPAEDTGEVLLSLPPNPLLGLDVIATRAAADWVSATECVSSTTPLSLADQHLADATVVAPTAGQSVVEIDPGGDGAADSEASTGLPATGGPADQRAVAATVSTRLAGANLLNGFTGAGQSVVAVEVVRAPSYTVSATGLPGGAAVEGDDPIVDVSIAGQDVIRLEAGEVEEEALLGLALGDLLDGLDPLLQPLQPIVRLSIPVTRSADPNGLTASVDAALLRVEVLPPPALGTDPLAVIELAPVEASVVAPAGGITCGGDEGNPMELQKVHSGPAVPGSTFDYTIAVGNVGECTLTDVRVVDVLTGPAGTTVLATEPAGAAVEPADGGYRITWSDVGDIAPNGRALLRIRVAVPEGAPPGATYRDQVTAVGSCDGREVTRTYDLPAPGVEARNQGPCDVTGSAKGASHVEVYPGEQFAYFVHAYNSGGQPCSGVTVVDELDDGVSFVSCSDGCTSDGQTVRWDVGTLQPGQSRTLAVLVQVDGDATGQLPNVATVDTAEGGPHVVRTDGPRVTDVSVLGPGTPASTPGRVTNLARTGGGLVSLPLAAGLGLLAAGLRRVRRRL